MYFLSDYSNVEFARHAGSKDKQKRKRKFNGLIPLALGTGALHGLSILDRDGITIKKESYKHHSSVKPNSDGSRLASQFEEELAKRGNKFAKVEKIPAKIIRPFGGKLYSGLSHISNKIDPRLSVVALMGGSALLGTGILKGGELVVNKLNSNKNKKNK